MNQKVKVKFRDTEFGMYVPSFTVPVLGSTLRFRGVYLNFEANGVPVTQLVLDHSILRHQVLDETWDENPVFATATDRVYQIIERMMREMTGNEVEIEYEGEDMEEKTIEVPAGTDKVTLKLGRRETPPAEATLRQMLMAVPSNRCAVVRVLERSKMCERQLHWDLWFPALCNTHEEMSKRKARVDRFAECRLCDTRVLLDERPVKNMTMLDMPGGMAFVFEVENDA
jgi:hypothetical protein